MLLVVNFFWWVSEYLLFYSLYFYEYIKYSRIFKNIYLKHQKGLKKKVQTPEPRGLTLRHDTY